MKKRISALIPVAAFAVIVAFLGYRLFDQSRRPVELPSVRIGKPAPDMSLPPLLEGAAPLDSGFYEGRVAVVNFFASWCGPCAEEHPYLMELSKRPDIVLVGVNYKDRNGRDWIAKRGNPYAVIGDDSKGVATINFGVYGLPETFLIDSAGIVRVRYAGALTGKVWAEKFEPLLGMNKP
ncbi:cytochrome C-type biogenesis protein [Alphaproteobacteria bacterium]|nr:cytochrome C-type biogenesis protein [Alphaproteobacteria bacterium]